MSRKSLAQFQGKEGKDIPKEVIEQVRKHINKDREKTTLNDVKLALGKLKLNKYVENIIYVHHVLSGPPALHTGRNRR